jgi:tetratricopeptide (TPR) repeat protein
MIHRSLDRFFFSERSYHFGNCMLTTTPPALYVNGLRAIPPISENQFTFLCVLLAHAPDEVPFEYLRSQLWPKKDRMLAFNSLHGLRHETTRKLRGDYIGTTKSAYALSVPVSTHLANCPDRVENFIGRRRILSDLEYARFKPKSARPQLHVITGGPELGKTSIAIEYAYSRKDQFQFIHYIEADSEEHLRNGLIKLRERAATLTMQKRVKGDLSRRPMDMGATEESLAFDMKELLRTSNDWLLILDNLQHPSLLKEYLPEKFNGQLLITARAYGGGELDKVAEISTFPVFPFSTDEAESFIWAALGREEAIDEEESEAVAEFTKQCGAVPGRLGGQCARVHASGDRIDTFLSKQMFQDGSRGSGEKTTTTPERAQSPHLVSMRKLLQDQYTSELMRLLPFLAAEEIDMRILISGLRRGSARHKALAEAIADDVDNTLLRPLVRAKVLQPYKTRQAPARGRRQGLINSTSFRVHRERQAELLSLLSGEVQHELAREVIKLLSFALPASEQVNILASDVALHHAQNVVSWPRVLQVNIDTGHGARLCERLGAELVRRGRFGEAEKYLKRSLVICERRYGAGSADVARATGFLGLLHMKWGDRPEAERLLRGCMEQLGSSSPKERAFWLRNLAEVCWHQAKLSEGMDLYKESIEIQMQLRARSSDLESEEQLGATQHYYASLLMSLCLDQQSEDMFKAALMTKGNLNPVSAEVALSLENYAVLLADQGRLDEALRHARRALRIQHELLGSEHPDLGATCNTVAYILQERAARGSGNFNNALRFAKLGFKLRDSAFQETHGDLSESLNRLASCNLAIGKLHDAWNFALHGLRLRKDRKNAANEPSIANSLVVAGLILSKAGQTELAEKTLLRAIEMLRDSSVSGGRGHAYCLQCLGRLYRDSARRLKAKSCFETALQMAESISTSHRLSCEIREDLENCECVVAPPKTSATVLLLKLKHDGRNQEVALEDLLLSSSTSGF